MADIAYGLEVLKKHIAIAPEKPGVYRMIGEGDKVLYVGKAKNINRLPARLQRMVSEIKRMEFIIVESEAKALLVENELIKNLEPKYNILLKDDKTFPHLMIDVQSEFPALLWAFCQYRCGEFGAGYRAESVFAAVLSRQCVS